MAHPTGFPAYMILAKLATFLPFGHIGFRINLLSLVCGAATVALTYRLCLRLMRDESPTASAAASAGALLLGFGSTFWLHATTAEVYAPNALALVVLAHLLWSGVVDRSARAMRMAAVLSGLGVGIHASFVVIGGPMWLAALACRGRDSQGARRAWLDLRWAIPLALVGVLVFAYLPIRAAQLPWRNWGDPQTVAALWSHLSGARIRDAFGDSMGGGLLDVNLQVAIFQLMGQVSWAGAGAVLGICLMALRAPKAALLVAAMWVGDFAFTVLLNPMGMNDVQTGLMTSLATVIASVFALAWVGKVLYLRAFSGAPAAILLFVTGLGLATPAMVSGGRVRDTRGLYHPSYQADRLFDRAPPRSLILVSSDDFASSTTYLQGVENRRPDCTTVVKQHVGDRDYIEGLLHHQGAEHLTPRLMKALREGEPPRDLLSILVAENAARRPVYWELGDAGMDSLVKEELRFELPLSRLFGPRSFDLQAMLIGYRSAWRVICSGGWPNTALRELAVDFSLLGANLAGRKEPGLAELALGEAFVTYRHHPTVTNNYGLLLSSKGQTKTAMNRFREVISMRPGWATGWYNLGTTLFNQGKVLEAADAFGEAARLGASPGQLIRMTHFTAIVHANRGRFELAWMLLDSIVERARPALQKEIREMMARLETRFSGSAAQSTPGKAGAPH